MTVIEADGACHVADGHGKVIAGPFESNAGRAASTALAAVAGMKVRHAPVP